MTYVTAVAARVRYKLGEELDLKADAARRLLLARPEGARGRFLSVLGGRNEFERTRQKKILDWLDGAERPGRPRLLMIGDSIRMRQADTTGYGIPAYRQLIGEFNITHIPHNTGNSNCVLEHLQDWLTCNPDVVHVNAGLHDLARAPDGAPQPEFNRLEDYVGNLRRIMEQILAARPSHLVWASNTPVVEAWHNAPRAAGQKRRRHRFNDDVLAYNAAAADLMRELDIELNDLHGAVVDAGVEDCILKDGVHLSHRGSALLGQQVADCLRRFL